MHKCSQMKDMQIRLSSVGIIFLLGLLFFSSCGSTSHHFHATDEGHLLGLKKEKDLKASVGYTPHLNSLPGNNINAQVGYSPIKHLGIQGSFFRIRNAFKGFEDLDKNVYQYNFNGAIGGYYFKAGKSTQLEGENNLTSLSTGKGLLLDGYLGYSRGNIENFYFEETGKVLLDFQKFYLQGGLHIFLDMVSASFSLRYAQLDYLEGKAFGKLNSTQLGRLDIISENNPFHFLESALKISIGKPTAPIQGYLTIAGIYDFGNAFLEIQPSTMQIGVTADIGHFFKR